MNGPDPSPRAVAALGAVARGRVVRRRDGSSRAAHGMVWLVDGERAERVVSALLTKFAQTVAGGPYVTAPDAGGPAALTREGEKLWAQWSRRVR